MKTSIHFGNWALALLALSTFNPQLSTPLAAAIITVNNTNDSGAGSLRQAIQSAATNDTIGFSVIGVITLTNGELLLTKSLTITGPGAANLAISGNTNSRVFEISSNVTASISALTLRDGHASNGSDGGDGDNGGGIYNAGTLTLSACDISANRSGTGGYPIASGGNGGSGGGIYNAGTLTLSACTVSGNFGGVGALDRHGGNGGGIYNAGTLMFIACTVSGNFGGGGGAKQLQLSDVGGGAGGGIYNSGALTLNGCTIAGNSAGRGGDGFTLAHYFPSPGGPGGGIYNSGTFTLTGCTVSGNSGGGGGHILNVTGADGGSGGGIYNAASTLSANLHSALVAVNSVGSGGAPGGAAGSDPDVAGSFTSQGHNLIGQVGGSTGFTNGVSADLSGSTNAPLDPMLGPLQDNGGPIFTMALLPGSPALDAGDDALLAAPLNLATDQRGFPRRSGAHVDIGAFELLAAGAPPYLTAPRKLANGAFQFSFGYNSGTSFTVLCAASLSLPVANWTVLGVATEIAPGQFQFTDLQATNSARRFYRLRSP